jgi:dTDP-4-dehydrorhamnose 3,5-epimerase-like enzyme
VSSKEPILIDLPSYADDRGVLVPVWNTDHMTKEREYTCAGVNLSCVQRAYHIENSQKGVIRGFHYHQREIKYFTVIQGMAKFVVFPLAPDEAFMMHKLEDDYVKEDVRLSYTFVLSVKKQQMLIIPPEHANGWMSLTDDCLLLALSSSTFERSKDDDVRIDPFIFGDVWGVEAR